MRRFSMGIVKLALEKVYEHEKVLVNTQYFESIIGLDRRNE
jgi:hypothetical protein